MAATGHSFGIGTGIAEEAPTQGRATMVGDQVIGNMLERADRVYRALDQPVNGVPQSTEEQFKGPEPKKGTVIPIPLKSLKVISKKGRSYTIKAHHVELQYFSGDPAHPSRAFYIFKEIVYYTSGRQDTNQIALIPEENVEAVVPEETTYVRASEKPARRVKIVPNP